MSSKIRPMSDIDPYVDKFRPARLPFEIANLSQRSNVRSPSRPRVRVFCVGFTYNRIDGYRKGLGLSLKYRRLGLSLSLDFSFVTFNMPLVSCSRRTVQFGSDSRLMYSMQTTAPVDQSLAACVGNSLSGDAGVQQVSPLLRVSMSLGSDTLSIRRPAPAALKTLSSGWAPSGLRH